MRASTPNLQRQILLPSQAGAGPLTAVVNFLIQSSLGELKVHGQYARYIEARSSAMLERLWSASLAPGWVPIQLAHAHYDACDSLELSSEDFAAQGGGVGEPWQDRRAT